MTASVYPFVWHLIIENENLGENVFIVSGSILPYSERLHSLWMEFFHKQWKYVNSSNHSTSSSYSSSAHVPASLASDSRSISTTKHQPPPVPQLRLKVPSSISIEDLSLMLDLLANVSKQRLWCKLEHSLEKAMVLSQSAESNQISEKAQHFCASLKQSESLFGLLIQTWTNLGENKLKCETLLRCLIWFEVRTLPWIFSLRLLSIGQDNLNHNHHAHKHEQIEDENNTHHESDQSKDNNTIKEECVIL